MLGAPLGQLREARAETSRTRSQHRKEVGGAKGEKRQFRRDYRGLTASEVGGGARGYQVRAAVRRIGGTAEGEEEEDRAGLLKVEGASWREGGRRE